MLFRRSRTRWSAALVAVLSLALVAGCGSDDGQEQPAAEASTTTAADGPTTTSTSGEKPPAGSDDDVKGADSVVTEQTSFSSPTGNIGCLIDVDYARCDIAERDWEPPAAPADCDLDYGQGLIVTAGRAADFVCAGDTALNSTTSGAPLAYGQSIVAGLLRCESARRGMSCRDVETGQGFTIARESYEITGP